MSAICGACSHMRPVAELERPDSAPALLRVVTRTDEFMQQQHDYMP